MWGCIRVDFCWFRVDFFCNFIQISEYNITLSCFPSQGERSFSEDEEQKLQTALALEKQALHLVLETSSFLLEQVGKIR